MTRQYSTTATVLGPWSLATCASFWESFTPAPQSTPTRSTPQTTLEVTFLAEADWLPARVVVEQDGESARLTLTGGGDLAAAAEQVIRFLALDIDARDWPEVGSRDPVIADAQAKLPGLRPCGFSSPYEAAAWSVLSQRIQMRQAARLLRELTTQFGTDGAFPAPSILVTLDADLPGRKTEYLRCVGRAALDGVLLGATLRAMVPEEALRSVQEVKGLGPFAAELVVLRGANAPDLAPRQEARIAAVIAELYGAEAKLDEISAAWRPFRTWASFHLRVLAERARAESGGRVT